LFKTAKRRFFATLRPGLLKKEAVEKFFANRACQRQRTPYNAPPLTRNNGQGAAGSEGFSAEYQPRKPTEKSKINA
jgi:hypothetical protein